MKKFLIRAGILIGVFVASVLIFSGIFNRKEIVDTRAMDSPTLPVAYMQVDGIKVNRMYGYCQDVDGKTMRETVTPVYTGRELALEIQSFDNEIRGVDYEVTSLTDGSLVENARVKNLTEDAGSYAASFSLETPILLDQEYLLTFYVDTGREEPIRYYTRIVQRSSAKAEGYLTFVEDFYENCLDKNLSEDQIAQLEPDSSVSNSSFQSVDIHSSRDMITWGELDPQLVKAPVPSIVELNAMTGSVSQEYIFSSEDSEGNAEYYKVREFYRMRMNQDQVILLDFERSATQIFDGNLPVQTGSGLNLGVVSPEVQYMTSQPADMAAFVIEGELWSYNRSTNKAARVFGYRSGSWDEREEGGNYEIKIVRLSETGDITFVVYGYMNSDRFEGQLGIGVYTYSAEQNTAEEELFLHSDTAFQEMRQSLSHLSYVSADGNLYLFQDRTLYRIRLEDGSSQPVKEGIDPQCFEVSDSQRTVAWMDEMLPDGSSNITVMNLDSGETRTISAGAGEKIKALGFINEDFIYGLARDQEILTDPSGSTLFPMYRVCIESFSGEILKDYQAEGYYVTGITVDNGLIELKRVQKTQEGGYSETNSDHIMNNLQPDEETVTVRLSVSERKKTQVLLEFSVAGSSENMIVLRTQYLETSDMPETVIELPENGQEQYYVYGKGRLLGIYAEPGEAVNLADEQVGTVLNSRQQYVWERGNWGTGHIIEASELPEVFRQGTADPAAIGDGLGEEYSVLNLTGCSLESLYYQLSRGCPVAARRSASSVVTIVGYDIYDNIWIYDPGTQAVSALAWEDAEAQFGACGNVFISCQKK